MLFNFVSNQINQIKKCAVTSIKTFEREQTFSNKISMKTKPALTKFEIHPLLKERWSPRAFSDQMIETEKLQRMFEAARWAPSSSNEQPWSFIVGRKGDSVYANIFSTLVEFNQLWAASAPVLILAIARKSSIKNPEKENHSARYDLGQAIAYLTFQAAADGLFVHQMGGFDLKKAAELFNVPENHLVVTVTAVGYIGDPEILHPNLKPMEYAERLRKPLTEQVFGTKFGESIDFVE